MMNRRIILERRPEGLLLPGDTRLEEGMRPVVGGGEALLRLDTLAMDPVTRIMAAVDIGIAPRIAPGSPLSSFGVGTIVESRSDWFPVGVRLSGFLGWADYQGIRDQAHLKVVPPGMSDEDALNLHGHTAMAAYFGMIEIGKVATEDAVLVSGAAGAVGGTAGQLARAMGARVGGIAGGREKCRWIVEELGFDFAIDYKAGAIGPELARHYPGGIDLFFDTVSGQLQDDVVPQLAPRARLVACGHSGLALGDNPLARVRPREDLPDVAVLSFNTMSNADRFDMAAARMAAWRDEGMLKLPVTWLDRLDQAPDALNMLFDGRSRGRVMIAVDHRIAG